jgi:hypothetical protein
MNLIDGLAMTGSRVGNDEEPADDADDHTRLEGQLKLPECPSLRGSDLSGPKQSKLILGLDFVDQEINDI